MGYNGGNSVVDQAAGKWKGILLQVGVPDSVVSGKHGPCPFCGGKDRFRFTNHEGRGGYICNQCTPEGGDGFEFIGKTKGLDFKGSAKLVREVLGLVDTRDDTPVGPSPARRKSMLNAIWKNQPQVNDVDHAKAYFAARGIHENDFTADMRYNPAVVYDDKKTAPAILTIVRDRDGKPCTIHRTFLHPEKPEKLDIDNPRRLMPGGMPDSVACRLLGGDAPSVLGVAEGIETAYAASILFDVPVWACINSGYMGKFDPPSSVSELVIFADNDKNFAGHCAAYKLANRMMVDQSRPHISVKVLLPQKIGTDWNDELLAQGGKK